MRFLHRENMEPLLLLQTVIVLLLLLSAAARAGLAITSPRSASEEEEAEEEKCPSSSLPDRPVMFLHRENMELLAELLRLEAWDMAVAGGLVMITLLSPTTPLLAFRGSAVREPSAGYTIGLCHCCRFCCCSGTRRAEYGAAVAGVYGADEVKEQAFFCCWMRVGRCGPAGFWTLGKWCCGSMATTCAPSWAVVKLCGYGRGW